MNVSAEEEKRFIGVRLWEPPFQKQGWGTLKFIWVEAFDGEPKTHTREGGQRGTRQSPLRAQSPPRKK